MEIYSYAWWLSTTTVVATSPTSVNEFPVQEKPFPLRSVPDTLRAAADSELAELRASGCFDEEDLMKVTSGGSVWHSWIQHMFVAHVKLTHLVGCNMEGHPAECRELSTFSMYVLLDGKISCSIRFPAPFITKPFDSLAAPTKKFTIWNWMCFWVFYPLLCWNLFGTPHLETNRVQKQHVYK